VFDDAEVEKARDFRAAMDQLKDAAEDVMLMVGEGLTPALTESAEAASALLGPLMDLDKTLDGSLARGSLPAVTAALGAFSDLIGGLSEPAFRRFRGETIEGGGALNEWAARAQYAQSRAEALEAGFGGLTDETEELSSEMVEARSDADQYADAMDGLNQRFVDAREAIDNLVGEELSKIDAFRQAEDSTKAYAETLLDAEAATRDQADAAIKAAEDMATFATGAYDTEAGVRAQIAALRDMAKALDPNDPLRAELKAYIGQLNGILTEVETDVRFDVDEASVSGVQADRDNLGKPITVPVNFISDDTNPATGGPFIRAGAGGSAGGGSVMASNSLWQQAVAWWSGRQNAGGSGGSSQGGGADEPVKATKGEKFDRAFGLAKVKYERGTYDVIEYLAELRRLRRVYQFAKHSPRGMALWRAIGDAEDDRRELMKGNQGDDRDPDDPIPPRTPGSGPDGPTGTGRMATAGVGGGGSSGGVTLVINAPNAVMVDRKAIQEVFDRYAPQINKALAKYRNGAG
jgi:hypothetical protein